MSPGSSGRTAKEIGTPTRTARWRWPGSSQRVQSIARREKRLTGYWEPVLIRPPVRTQSTRLDPTPQTKSVIWHDSQAEERLWVVCLLTCQSLAEYLEDPPETLSPVKISCCTRCTPRTKVCFPCVSDPTIERALYFCDKAHRHEGLDDKKHFSERHNRPRAVLSEAQTLVYRSTNGKWENRKQLSCSKSIILEIVHHSGCSWV